MNGGWTGVMLRVDLTAGRWERAAIPREWLVQYVGGRGLGTRLLWEEGDPKADPFAPDNPLIFATGPLTGAPVPCGARYMVITKGPLTGAITHSNSGGHWGPELKFAGYDLLVIRGRSPRPCWLLIDDDRVEIRDAAAWWGQTVSRTEDGLRSETGLGRLRVACIGPAGERRVRFAAIMNDKHRAAGRSGVGAVMGAKNLKAIAVRGSGGVRVADPEAFLRAVWRMRAAMADHPGREQFARLGTPATVDLTQTFGGLPTRNFQQGQFEHAEKLNGNSLRDTRLVANKACFACTIACGRVTRLGDGAGKYLVNTHPRNWAPAGEGPEYETVWALGADVGVGDLDAVIKANYLCNDLGMDPISMGATLAAAMELYERGVLTDADVETPLRFGSAEALIRMVEATAYREGFGDRLAEGAMRMASELGRPDVFMGSKGQEFPAYDPRAFQGMGVAFATANRGACHLRAWTPGPETTGKMDPHTPEGKGQWVAEEQNRTTGHDNTGLCMFVKGAGASLEMFTPCLAAATGVPYTAESLIECGERTWNLERLWNVRAGLTRADDRLPRRLLEEPLREGPAAGVVVHLDRMLADYYKARGWNEQGEPTREKLAELGVDCV